MTAKLGPIYIGIGGWTFAPWRGVFYPNGLPHAKELPYAAERLTSIEVNGTFCLNVAFSQVFETDALSPPLRKNHW